MGGWQNGGNSLSGEGTCVPITDFSADPGGVIWMSNVVYEEAHCTWPGCSETHHADLWSNFAVSMVMSVRGDFEGGGEVVQVTGSNYQLDPAATSQLRVHTEQWGEIDAIQGTARSLFVGLPQQSAWITHYRQMQEECLDRHAA